LIGNKIYFDDLTTKQAVGRKIRAFRLDRGVSRLELGNLVGVSDQQIMKYELGQDHISAGMLWKICSTLRCPIDLIFIPTEPGPAPEPSEDAVALPDEQAILAAFRRITPPAVQMRVARLILALSARGAEER
jgi:transcriptional regulator with XRE-family HTH domain